MHVRRVVTGHNREGKAILTSDTNVAAITLNRLPGNEFIPLWGNDGVPTLPESASQPITSTYYPPPGGTRFGLFTVGPASKVLFNDLDIPLLLEEMEEKLPGMAAAFEIDNPGMHTTKTVDFEYVLTGEIWLELDNGKEVHLCAGDTVVQNGTRHAWRNKSTEPCRLLLFSVGARRNRDFPEGGTE